MLALTGVGGARIVVPNGGPFAVSGEAGPRREAVMATTDAATATILQETAGEQKLDPTIARDPHRPGAGRARLVAYGIPVWALIGAMADVADEGEVGRAAREYRIPVAAVRAAVAYYRDHRAVIDDLLEANDAVIQ